MYRIDKGVAIPEIRHGRSAKYPWREMDVGDSFYVEGKAGHIGDLASQQSMKLGRTFTTRRDAGGVRVWRVT